MFVTSYLWDDFEQNYLCCFAFDIEIKWKVKEYKSSYIQVCLRDDTEILSWRRLRRPTDTSCLAVSPTIFKIDNVIIHEYSLKVAIRYFHVSEPHYLTIHCFTIFSERILSFKEYHKFKSGVLILLFITTILQFCLLRSHTVFHGCNASVTLTRLGGRWTVSGGTS